MELQHVNVKLRLKDAGEWDLEPLIPIFHDWIREQQPGELLLDIADYRHVPAGPGVVLIGHDGDYSVDQNDERSGVRYNRKAPLEGNNEDRLRQAARAALVACQRLEKEPRLGGKLDFSGREIEVFFNDRMLVPNTDVTRQETRADLKPFFGTLFRNGEYAVSYERDPRRLFSISVTTSQSFSTADLLKNLDA